MLTDFALSALVGGGLGAYLALRDEKDWTPMPGYEQMKSPSEYANKFGGLVMQFADKVLTSEEPAAEPAAKPKPKPKAPVAEAAATDDAAAPAEVAEVA